FEQFSKSIHYDYRLAEYDIYHSAIHTLALKNSGILTKEEAERIDSVLNEILFQIREKKFKPDLHCEDIHSDIQNRLEDKLGKLAMKIHTFRSRNDQIVFDEKWYCLNVALDIHAGLTSLLTNLKELMKKYQNQPFIGYTHTQKAQVVLFSDYLGAFFEMFYRDRARMATFSHTVTPHIGAAALTGSSLKRKDYDKAIKQFLKERKIAVVKAVENSLDNVSDRDFIVEILSVLSIIQMHFSRLAEDLIIYSTKEFGLLKIGEEFCTGSSLMPHKKNPDFLELVRGSTGKIYGNLIAVLTMIKGLPLTYNRDMQFDKEPLFSSVDIVSEELKIIDRFIKTIEVEEENVKRSLEDEQLYATELAELLVFKGIAFSEAHTIIGRLVRYSEEKNVKIKDMSEVTLREFHSQLKPQEIKRVMTPRHAISSKKSISRRLPKVD
ncbi:MAG: argininosuccinate lyase, partial [Candidatus Omnitrophota bacterium]